MTTLILKKITAVDFLVIFLHVLTKGSATDGSFPSDVIVFFLFYFLGLILKYFLSIGAASLSAPSPCEQSSSRDRQRNRAEGDSQAKRRGILIPKSLGSLRLRGGIGVPLASSAKAEIFFSRRWFGFLLVLSVETSLRL